MRRRYTLSSIISVLTADPAEPPDYDTVNRREGARISVRGPGSSPKDPAPRTPRAGTPGHGRSDRGQGGQKPGDMTIRIAGRRPNSSAPSERPRRIHPGC